MSLLTIACRQRGMIVFVFIIFTVAFVGDCRFSSNAYWLTCVFPAAAHFHIAQAASENTNDREGVAGTRPTMESQLDPKKFPRIHRSAIVNIDRIRELQPWFHNEYRVILKDGTELMLSRSCRKKLGELLGSAI